MKILLVDDHALFRDGMHYVLNQLDEQVEILDAGDFQSALELAGGNPDLDLALLDLNLPGSEGVASIKLFHMRFPSIPVVVVSGTDHRGDMEKAMNHGAMGFISKASSATSMVNALRAVLDGGIYLPPQLVQQAIAGSHGKEDKRSSRTNEFGLTPRQMEVLGYLGKGLSNKDIAEATGLAEGTVKIHVAAVYHTLHVGSRLEAVHAAKRLGLIREEESRNP
jgi:DNA-binding NarL/FixJ family response regulator